MTSISLRRLTVLVLAGLAGCSTQHACFDNTDYQTAINRPKLQMPEGVPGSERIAPLAIPTVGETVKLDPEPQCIDEPPSFFGRKPAGVEPPAPPKQDPQP